MGKGKPINPKRKPESEKNGCICPIGCEINEVIVNPPPDDAVLMVCSNDKCAYNQNLHKQCYDALEISLIRTIQSSMGRTRDWTDEQCRKAMWNRVYDLIYRHCKCFCGGHLKKFEDAVGEVAAAGNNAEANNEAKKKKKNKAGRQDLPKLVLDKSKVAGSSSANFVSAPSSKPTVNQNQNLVRPKTTLFDDEKYETKPNNNNNNNVNYIPGLVFTNDTNVNHHNQNQNQNKKVSSSKNGVVQQKSLLPAEPFFDDHQQPIDKSIGSIRIDKSPIIDKQRSIMIADHSSINLSKGFAYSNVESFFNDVVCKISSNESNKKFNNFNNNYSSNINNNNYSLFSSKNNNAVGGHNLKNGTNFEQFRGPNLVKY